MMTIEVVVEQFWNKFEEYSTNDDIRQAFKTKDTLLYLDMKLGDFGETHIEVGNYRKKEKDKNEVLNFLDATRVTEIIEKFKTKYPDIALV